MGDIDLKEKNQKQENEQIDDIYENEASKKDQDSIEGKKTKKRIFERIKLFFQNPKKRLAFIIILGIILIALVGGGIYLMNNKNDLPATNQDVVKDNTTSPIQKFQAVLDGAMTDENSANKHPVAVMVENHVDSRPQAGLDKASIVYEAIAEGGITRYLAVFGTHEAEKVGPVRSARTYFVDWAHGFDAFYAHVGGNMDALQKINKDKIYDLDQFKYSAPYWRELTKNLAIEHTMYTSTIKLREQASKNNYPTANNFNINKYKNDPSTEELDNLPPSQTVTINYSTNPYKVDFIYDKETNSYKRNMAGKPHNDRVTKSQINPKNIVVMTMKKRPTVTEINEQGYIMDTVGSGKARFFIDGKEITGTWKKDTISSREIFYDSTGTEIVFNRGQLWICVISPDIKVTVQ